MISISSLPILPDSPACGFNPAMAMRGPRAAGLDRSVFERGMRDKKSASNRPTRTISDCFSACGTSLNGMCVVTSATVIFPPVKHIAKFLTPQRSAKNSVCPGSFMNRPCYDCIELAAPGECDGFFECSRGGTRSFRRGMPGCAVRIFTNGFVLGGFRDSTRFQCSIDNLRSDSGAIAQRNANARFFSAHAPTLISSVKWQAYTECGVAAALGCWRTAANRMRDSVRSERTASRNRREWSEETEDTNVAVRLRSRWAGCRAPTQRCRSAPASEAGGSHTKCISCVSQRLLVIVIEFAQSSTSRIKRGDGRLRLSGRGRAECASERLDVSLCAQAGNPAFLNTLCFLLNQSLLDIVPCFGK